MIVLEMRRGTKICALKAHNIVFRDGLNDFSEMSFALHKSDFESEPQNWDAVTDFKLVWVKDWDMHYEINVETQESDDTVKNVTAKSLAASELSQINLYNFGVNTEDDIARKDYKPTVLHNSDKSASLLDRMIEKAPHYRIGHVDTSVAGIQRTFSFDGKSIYDCMKEIGEEINCLISPTVVTGNDGKLDRVINVYDLESHCLECGTRGEFYEACDNCGSKNIIRGYGNDTTIYVSTENLADSITYSVNSGSVKNCFRLEAGDDLMTATIMNCNPNGSQYLWYISEDTKKDMSSGLVKKLDAYDALYKKYYEKNDFQLTSSMRNSYNALVSKYSGSTKSWRALPDHIYGYPSMMEYYYDAVDLYYYLVAEMMPNVTIAETDSGKEAAKLKSQSLSPVAMKSISTASKQTVESSVLSMAKAIIDGRYSVKISESNYANGVWNGSFVVSSATDENDVTTTDIIAVTINDNYEVFVKQKIDKLLSKNTSSDSGSLSSLFKMSLTNFKYELHKYSLNRLSSIHDSCQGCLDILIEHGISNDETWTTKTPNLYNDLYQPYFAKIGAIEEEIVARNKEISVVYGTYDETGKKLNDGVITVIESKRLVIQNALDMEKYLGKDDWLEFSSFRRDDVYKNENYISDGLSNNEMFEMASQFIDAAKKEIVKSATMQHTISASLKNLLSMKEFAPIVDSFEIGNWIHIRVDDKLFKLRIVRYDLQFDNFDSIGIEFSDAYRDSDAVRSVGDILKNASSMASSYSYVARQAKKGSEGNSQIRAWVTEGLSLTNTKIVNAADNQNILFDNHGILCREYLPVTDKYDDKQLKIINRGLYLTDDGWRTSKAGIGDFMFWNPATKEMQESYGVIADTLVGSLILGENVGIYNKSGSVTIDDNGFKIVSDIVDGDVKTAFKVSSKSGNKITDLMYIDTDGKLIVNGSVQISSKYGAKTLNELSDSSRIENIEKSVKDISIDLGRTTDSVGSLNTSLSGEIDTKYNSLVKNISDSIDAYKTEVGQYMTYDENGLTLGATGSAFKTVIDNKQLSFKNEDQIVSYINGNSLYINNAVINNSMMVGRFFFCPRSDGGISVVWR